MSARIIEFRRKEGAEDSQRASRGAAHTERPCHGSRAVPWRIRRQRYLIGRGRFDLLRTEGYV
jgi:hypothetical protein